MHRRPPCPPPLPPSPARRSSHTLGRWTTSSWRWTHGECRPRPSCCSNSRWEKSHAGRLIHPRSKPPQYLARVSHPSRFLPIHLMPGFSSAAFGSCPRDRNAAAAVPREPAAMDSRSRRHGASRKGPPRGPLLRSPSPVTPRAAALRARSRLGKDKTVVVFVTADAIQSSTLLPGRLRTPSGAPRVGVTVLPAAHGGLLR